MKTPRMVSERELVGKRIVKFTYETDPHGGNTQGMIHYNPRIYLDDGSFLYFVTEESWGGADYGLFVGRSTRQTGGGWVTE